ncbi:MAG: lipoyl protein ligase domain-containing protein [Candidatus Freyarchaeota archaeon]
MVKLRLLLQNFVEPDYGWALDETVMLHVKNGDAPSTAHLWRSPPCVVLGNLRLSDDKVSLLERNGIRIIRRVSDGPTFYAGDGAVLFGFIIDTSEPVFPRNLNELYNLVFSPLIETVEGLLPGCSYDGMSYLSSGDSTVSQVSQFWYYDVLVFQGVIYLDVDSDLVNSLGVLPRRVSSVARLSSRKVSVEDFVDEAVLRLREKPWADPFESGLTELEERTLSRVLESKYRSLDWNLNFSPPYAYGKLLIEALTAYPPTKMCHRVVENIREAIRISGEEERIELRVWSRGRGLPPGVFVSNGVIDAAKKSQIPGVVINGELKFGRTVPTVEDLVKAIMEEIVRIK